MDRTASVKRTTKETQIIMDLNLDGKGVGKISTGIGFFDHMLEGFTKHGFFDMELTVNGDLHVDGHHTAIRNLLLKAIEISSPVCSTLNSS